MQQRSIRKKQMVDLLLSNTKAYPIDTHLLDQLTIIPIEGFLSNKQLCVITCQRGDKLFIITTYWKE
ncbi:MAG: hypothetical protein K2X94_01275 [Amoebophilaceae bacterium]|nr:hypothetical protein [Amoebophilaceae bacterium]